MLKQWNLFSESIKQILDSLSFRDDAGKDLLLAQGFQLWLDKTNGLKQSGNYLYLIGNGASASMSSHFAADINKNADIHTQVFTDLALITAMANDISYDQVFAQPLKKRAKAGDMLVTISSSGSSPNILAAINAAQEMGLYVVTVSAMREDNPSRSMGHLNIYTPATTYGHAETAHAAVLHFWTDLLVSCHQRQTR